MRNAQGPPSRPHWTKAAGRFGHSHVCPERPPVFAFFPAATSPRITLRRWPAHPGACPEVAPEGRYQALGPQAQEVAARLQSWGQTEGRLLSEWRWVRTGASVQGRGHQCPQSAGKLPARSSPNPSRYEPQPQPSSILLNPRIPAWASLPPCRMIHLEEFSPALTAGGGGACRVILAALPGHLLHLPPLGPAVLEPHLQGEGLEELGKRGRD